LGEIPGHWERERGALRKRPSRQSRVHTLEGLVSGCTAIDEVMATSAVQLMIWIVVLPMARSPKLTGCEHWSGNATGDPRHMTFAFESVT
jgi:hypothetical protein